MKKISRPSQQVSDSNEELKKTPFKALLAEIIETVSMSFIVLLLIFTLIAVPEKVDGASMEPTLYDKERVLVEKVSKHFKPYRRGDIVVLHPPGHEQKEYVKRIVALPGEDIKIFNCKVYVSNSDGKFELEEKYLFTDQCTTSGTRFRDGRSLHLEENEFLYWGIIEMFPKIQGFLV